MVHACTVPSREGYTLLLFARSFQKSSQMIDLKFGVCSKVQEKACDKARHLQAVSLREVPPPLLNALQSGELFLLIQLLSCILSQMQMYSKTPDFRDPCGHAPSWIPSGEVSLCCSTPHSLSQKLDLYSCSGSRVSGKAQL